MKGGGFRQWFGNQDYVINWRYDGAQVSEAIMEAYPYLSRTWLGGHQFYFCNGVTWSDLSTSRFAARYLPSGFVFDVKGSAAFPEDVPLVLGLLNTRFAHVVLNMINPTVSYQVGDIERLPVPSVRSPQIEVLVNQCVELSRQDSRDDEKTYEFLAPLRKSEDRKTRHERLHALETKIDTEVSRLYGLSQEDLAAIDRELSDVAVAAEDEEAEETAGVDEDADIQAFELSQADIFRRWISYAIGTVLGRFEIGKPGGLGRGDFSETVVAEVRKLVDADGIMPFEAGHAQDLAAHTLTCLNLMLGAEVAHGTIRMALGEGDSLDALRGWLDRFTGQPAQSFWRYHFQQYRKRPVYWPFQSPNRRYTVWVFHERFGSDTLFRIRNEFVESRLRLAEREIADLRVRATKDRKAAKELDRILDLADDLTKFSANLKTITERGYTPQIDDGVLLNAAPLHEVLPSWPETRAAWKELEDGKYDWSHQAMAYWPERVKEACKTNRSFAIAHGMLVPEHNDSQTAGTKRGRRKKA